MNISSLSPGNATAFAGPNLVAQQSQVFQMLLTLMMSLLQQQTGAGGLSPGPSPFGCNSDLGQSSLQGSSLPNSNGSGLPGFSAFGGSAPQRGMNQNGHDSYVPLGNSQSGEVSNLGSGVGGDAVRWALGKEGISESNNPDAVRAISRGAWQPWCADFVSQAYANSPGGSPFGHQSSVAGILSWGRQNERFINGSQAQQNPSMLRPGDVAVWKSNGRSHVGLVTGVNANGTFNTIEGNTSDAVRRRTHSFDGGLTGFVRPRG